MDVPGKVMYLLIVILFINFFISGLIINFFQLILWLTIKPTSPQLYRKINYYCLYSQWIQIVFLADWWSGSTCSILTDDKTWEMMGKEHAIVLMNHSDEVDWLMGWVVCEQSRLLASSKVFMKKAIQWVPVVGWAWQFAEIVFLERNWEKDREPMEQQIRNLTEHPDPVWLLMFAEGTRFTPSKHAASVEFAQKSGLAPLQHLLVPRTKGFLLTVEQLRGKFPAIYCATLAFNTKEGAKPTLKSMLLGRRVIGEMLLERIPLDEVPEDPAQAALWLHENYRHKDQMIDVYKKEGSFPASLPAGHHFEGPIRCHYRPRRLWSVLVIMISSYFTLPPVFYALYSLLFSGIINVLVAVIFMLGVIFALYKLVGLTRISSTGSTYGGSSRTKSS